ncbi:T9SS type A sorting domain-containing protein [Ekhidna sp.]
MAKCVIIVFFASIGFSIKAQTIHRITVAINQGADCPITGLSQSDVFAVYPNPAATSFTIQSSIREAEIKLIDLNGRKVRSAKMTDGELKVDVLDLPKGIYIIRFEYQSGSDRIKIRIQ